MRRLASWCFVVFLAVAAPAAAVVCQPDVTPAATLLIPYFEVDLEDPYGTTTLFTIVNSFRDTILTQVNVFSDGGVPIVGFWVYLQGYDVQAVNLRDVIANGNLPVTGPGIDPFGTISGPPMVFPGCGGGYGPIGPATIDAMFLEAIRMQLTGQPSLYTGLCAGFDYGDNVARGYVTVDVVQECSMYLPNELGYQLGALGMNNVLLGDWMLVDPNNNFEQAFAAVHVEADASRFGVDDRTFYGEYNTMSAADRREPLPSTWQARFDGFDDAELLVWRGVPGTGASFHCPLGPWWYPLAAANSSGGYGPLILFDDEGAAMAPAAAEVTFPGATQRISVSGPEVGFVTTKGHAYLNLQHWASFPDGGQAWVAVISRSEGRFATGIEATALDSSCSAAPVTIAPTGPRAENPGY